MRFGAGIRRFNCPSRTGTVVRSAHSNRTIRTVTKPAMIRQPPRSFRVAGPDRKC